MDAARINGKGLVSRGTYYRSCLKKRRYHSQSEASHFAQHRADKGAPKLRPYECSLCGGWHLTRQLKQHSSQPAGSADNTKENSK